MLRLLVLVVDHDGQSVPPVWKALQGMWQWIDMELVDDPDDDDIPIWQKQPWWENMVAKLTEEYGLLNLA
jgi:hypothetical protein